MSYTPRHLAEKILTSRTALEGERKQVTVLFADVTGSMDLAEQVDPEDWHRLMDRFFAILTDGVHRFEGTVNQYTGDGVMALFGAPIAHEDHAQRACHAALHLTDALRQYANDLRLTRGLNFSARIGLNSGEVVVGKIGDDLRMDYTAQGHTVGLAARMEQLAEPGRTFLTQYTAALVAGYFELEDLGVFSIKGARNPLRVYALRGIGSMRTRFEVARRRGFSRFVGRDREAALLQAALERALAGEGQTVALSGEPGVGKTRLCHELLQRCRARGIATYETQCVAHGRAIPFLTALNLMRGYFGITDQDGDEAARRKIAGTLVLLGDDLTDALPLLFDFLGVPDPVRRAPHLEPEARLRQLLDVCRRIVYARSRREPAVLLIEDLHWIDGHSEAFVEALAAATQGTRSLLMVNFRPEYVLPWVRSAEGAAPPHLDLRLEPLGPVAITELMDELLGADATLSPVKELIRERTGGNPFFVEEVVQSLFDQGILVRRAAADGETSPPVALGQAITEITIPPSLHAVLAARIDRLPEVDKQMLQTAAVIGREFAEPVLAHVLAQDAGWSGGPGETRPLATIDRLVAADFVRLQTAYPERIYAFRHPLTQEVAYHSPLAERRAQVHAAVARAVTALYPDRLDERAALIAHHWRHAGEVSEAARWRRRAAEWVRFSNPAESLQHWRIVRELLPLMRESPERAGLTIDSAVRVLELGRHLGLSAADAKTIFEEGEALAQKRGDRRALAMLVSAYGAVRSHSGTAEEFLECGLRATLLADQTDDLGLQLATRTRLVVAHVTVGNVPQALALTEYCLAATDDLQLGASVLGYSPRIRLMKERGALLIDLGRLDEASAQLDAAARLARAQGDIEVAGGIHGEYVTLARIRGDAATALAHAQQIMRVAEKLGSPFFRAGAALSFGHAHILAARWAEARDALADALGIARAGHARVETEALALAWLAQAHLGSGKLALALETVTEALAVAQRRHTRLAECIASIGRARVLLRLGRSEDPPEIAADLSHALALAEDTGAKSNEPFIRVELARLAALTGDEAERVTQLRTAHRLFDAMGAAARVERVAALLRSDK